MTMFHSSRPLARFAFKFGLSMLVLTYLLMGCETKPKEDVAVPAPQTNVAAEPAQEPVATEKSQAKDSGEKSQEDRAMEKMEEALASEKFTPDRPMEDIMADMLSDTFEGALEAVQTPIRDIGLIEDAIPADLEKYAQDAYAMPEPMTCEEIFKQIARINVLLGADPSAPALENGVAIVQKGEYITRGGQAAQARVADTVTGYVNIMPFRSVVRYLSGAERHVRDIDEAQRAGIARRSFLTGLAEGHDCGPMPTPAKPATAAPAPPPPVPEARSRQRSVVKP
jgi:hypothetical protein